MPQNLPFPEGDAASEKSDSQRSLQKINQLLYKLYALMGGGGSGGTGLESAAWSQVDSAVTAAAAALGPQTYFTRATISAPASNTQNVGIGPTSAANHYSLAPGETYTIQMPTGKKGDLAAWFAASVSGSQALRTAYVL